MGDRSWWNENCIQCGGTDTVEVFDAPSSLMWSKKCEKCGWDDGRRYFEIGEREISLMTEDGLKELQKKDPKVKAFRQEVEKLFEESERV